MPRANRHYLPGYIWHITHRCHKSEFLLKFARDQRRWLQWLFEAKKRFGTCILNYVVTSNHVHLVIRDDKREGVIPQTMQLIAGRTGQEYNQRKDRKGAFWEDRYHATAVEADSHLIQCMVYVDLNMVRAGVVRHPSEWSFCGYNEILNPRQRYSLVDQKSLTDLLGIKSMDKLREIYPVRNNAPLLCSGVGFIIIPAGLNAPLEFLTGFTGAGWKKPWRNRPVSASHGGLRVLP